MDLDRLVEIAADYRLLGQRFAAIVRRLRAADNGLPDLGLDWGKATADAADFTFLGGRCRLRFEIIAFETGSTFGVLLAERLLPDGAAKPGSSLFFDADGKLYLTHPRRNPLSLGARADLRRVVAHLLEGLVPRIGLGG